MGLRLGRGGGVQRNYILFSLSRKKTLKSCRRVSLGGQGFVYFFDDRKDFG